MKKFLLALVIGIGFTHAATAQFRPGPGGPNHPGPNHGNGQLIQAAERLRLEALRLEQAIVYGRLNYQAVEASRRLSRQADNLTDCLRRPFGGGGGGGGVGGRIDVGGGRIDIEVGVGNRPGPNRQCTQEIQRTDQALNLVQRSIYGVPFHSPVVGALNRTMMAMQQVIAAQPGPGPGPGPGPQQHLVAKGEMNRQPFSFQAMQTQTLVNLCVEFGRARRIFQVDSLYVNGRWIDLRRASLEQACRIVASEAR
ncbi:MAG: hypothetical protein ABL958_13950 [Bdellovibrionia bacterium]